MRPLCSSPIFSRTLVAALLVLVGGLGGCATGAQRAAHHTVRVNATAQAPVQPGKAFVIVAAEPKNESTLLYSDAARFVKGALETKGLYQAPRADRADVIVEIEYAMAAPRAGGRREPAMVVGDDDMLRVPLEKSLVLTAREARSTDGLPPRSLWRVELSATDASNDLRKYLPLLATAAIERMGVDSGGEQTVVVNETDKTVTLLKRSR